MVLAIYGQPVEWRIFGTSENGRLKARIRKRTAFSGPVVSLSLPDKRITGETHYLRGKKPSKLLAVWQILSTTQPAVKFFVLRHDDFGGKIIPRAIFCGVANGGAARWIVY